MTKRLLTVGEAAETLSLGRTKLYELMASGELESVQIGKRSRRIPAAAIDDYIQKLLREAAA